jgi:Flp pilus assembly protein TadG
MRILRSALAPATRRGRHQHSLLGNEDGATAVEFGLLGVPLVLFVLGIMGMGLYYLAKTSLEYGVEAAARKIRTGEAEKGNITVGQFKNLICRSAVGIDCGKVTVILQSADTWSSISPKSCTTKGSQAGSTGDAGDSVSTYSGSASQVVLVTACYKWPLADSFSFMKFSTTSGPTMIQAATAFKNEPYN